MKIFALIPARSGSKGIPGKNIKMLGGKPLISYTIQAGLKCSELADIIVSTNDEEIAQISKDAGASVPFLRPANLATDESPTIDTVIHAVHFLENQNEFYDAICLLQPTCPFRSQEEISQAIRHFKDSGADSLMSVREVPHQYNPHWVFEHKPNSPYLRIATGESQIISRRQNLPKAYFRDGSVYIAKTQLIKAHHSLYGNKIAYFLNQQSIYLNLDTPSDWDRAEQLIKNQ